MRDHCSAPLAHFKSPPVQHGSPQETTRLSIFRATGGVRGTDNLNSVVFGSILHRVSSSPTNSTSFVETCWPAHTWEAVALMKEDLRWGRGPHGQSSTGEKESGPPMWPGASSTSPASCPCRGAGTRGWPQLTRVN